MAHPDLDRLLDFSLRFAQDMLKKRREFYPFAASIKPNGELNSLAIHADDDRPQPKILVEQLTALLKDLASSGELHAAALCHDSLVSAGGGARKDAIAVALEHSNGECVTVLLPYSKGFLGYRFDPLIAMPAERKFFP